METLLVYPENKRQTVAIKAVMEAIEFLAELKKKLDQ